MSNTEIGRKFQAGGEVAIAAITVAGRHRHDMGDIKALAESIERIGLLQPIGITTDHRLQWGLRRVEAHKLLGRATIPAVIVPDGDDLLRECHENTRRLDFSPVEAVAIGKDIEAHEAALAKRRMINAHASPGKLPELEKGQTRDKVASVVGVSGRTYEKAKAVVEAAEQDPEKFGDLVAKMQRTRRVTGVHRELNQRRDEQRVLGLRPVSGKFKGLLIDPAWESIWMSKAARADCGYATMSHEELLALPVADWAEDNSHLYLCTLNNFMPLACELMRHWGFKHKSILTWRKPKWGRGEYFRNQTEQVLFGVRGELKTRRRNISTVFDGPVSRVHSEKPEELYEIIRAQSYPPFGEAFQRKERPDFANLYEGASSMGGSL